MTLRFCGTFLSTVCICQVAFGIQEPQSPYQQGQSQVETVDQQAEQGKDAADAQPGDVKGAVEQYMELQGLALDAELKAIQRRLKMDDQWVARIRKSLDGEVEATAKRLGSEGGRFFMARPNLLDVQLADTIMEQVAGELPEAKQPLMKAYRKAVMELRKLENENAIDGVLVFLDNNLCLSESQVNDLRQRYAQAWDSRFNDMAAMAPLNGLGGGRAVVEVLDVSVWKTILRPIQFDEFKKLDGAFWAMMLNELPNAEKLLKQLCDTAIEMKLSEYGAMFDISKQQAKVLSVAKKGASVRVQRRLGELRELMSTNPAGGANMKLMVGECESIASNCEQEPVWQKTLVKVFDQEQLAAIKQREASRNELAQKQLINSMVLSFSQDHVDARLDPNQHRKLVGLIDRAVVPSASNIEAVLRAFCAVEEEEFQEVLAPKQWGSLRLLIRSVREMWEPMVEEAANEDEPADVPSDE